MAHATVDCIKHMHTTCAESDLPLGMQEDEEKLRAELVRFYIEWDPYFGLAEGWAPDFVSSRRGRERADPERTRLMPPEPPPSVQTDDGVIYDPEAEPRPVGPPEADEEQAMADAVAFLDEPVPVRASPPPPPAPVPLSAEMIARIESNRAEARSRRLAKARQDREARLREVAPWRDMPDFGCNIFS